MNGVKITIDSPEHIEGQDLLDEFLDKYTEIMLRGATVPKKLRGDRSSFTAFARSQGKSKVTKGYQR